MLCATSSFLLIICLTFQRHISLLISPFFFFFFLGSPSSSCGLRCRAEESAMEKGSKSFDLFPSLVAQNQDKDKENEKEKKEEGRELTFFYGGRVYSFHNISPLQIGAILSAAEPLKEASPPPSVVDRVHHQREEKVPNYPIEVAAVVQQQHHLPLANKASLARFLANRRSKQRVKDLDMNGDSTTSSLHYVKNGNNEGFDGNQLIPAFKKQRQSCTTTTTTATTTHALPLFPH